MNNQNESSDPLADRLRREAMAERPAFSPELHEQILRSFPSSGAPGEGEGGGLFGPFELRSPPQPSPGVPGEGAWQPARFVRWSAAVAAIILLGLTLMHSHHTTPTNPPVEIAKNIPVTPSQPDFSIDSSIDVGGVLSAKLWPPEIAVSLPSTDAPTPSQPAVASIDSSDSLLATLQNPTQSATSALVDAMPPSVRTLIEMASASR